MTHEADRSVLRWGGLTSIGGGLLFIFIFAWVIILTGPDPDGPAEAISRFPEIKAVRIVENSLYLAVMVLWVPVYLALYRALNRIRPAPALFGSALAMLGLGLLTVGAIPHVAFAQLSDLYHAPGATAGDRAALVLVWQGTQGFLDTVLLTGLLVLAVGIVLLGLAMRADPAFGRRAAWLSMLLGTAALAGGTVELIAPPSAVAAIGFFALIGFHLILGTKVYRLSKLVPSTHAFVS